jgi:hypothetical protein
MPPSEKCRDFSPGGSSTICGSVARSRGTSAGARDPVLECPVWSRVLVGMTDTPDPARVAALQREVVRSRNSRRIGLSPEAAASPLPEAVHGS